MENEFKKLHIGFFAGNKKQTNDAFNIFISFNSDIIETIEYGSKSKEIQKILLKDGTTISNFWFLIDKGITCKIELDQVLVYRYNYVLLSDPYYRHMVQDFVENSIIPTEYQIFCCNVPTVYET